jgi:hypothetical protein
MSLQRKGEPLCASESLWSFLGLFALFLIERSVAGSVGSLLFAHHCRYSRARYLQDSNLKIHLIFAGRLMSLKELGKRVNGGKKRGEW